MSSYIGYFKSNIEVKEPEKGIPIDDMIDTLKMMEKTLDGLPKASEKTIDPVSRKTPKEKGIRPTTKSYFRASKPCCIQIEICYEVDDNDENVNFLCGDTNCNIADYYLRLLTDNLIYNTLPSSAILNTEKSKHDTVVMESGGKEILLQRAAVGLKQVKSFDKKVQKLLHKLKETDDITSFSLGINEALPEKIELDNILSGDEDWSVLTEHSRLMTMSAVDVIVISPYLSDVKQKKWTIMFNPKLPSELAVSDSHEYKAEVEDKEYLSSLQRERFGVGDRLKCDLSYTIKWRESSLIAKVTSLVIHKVIEHG